MSITQISLDKRTLINWMPLIAIVIIMAIFFLPIPIGEIVFIGFVLGSLGKAAYPFYRKWKENEEELQFNYAYLMPVLIAIGVATLGYASGFITSIIPANAPTWIAYGCAVVLGFGGVEALDEFMKYWDFFHDIWQTASDEGYLDYGKEEEEITIIEEPIPDLITEPIPVPIVDETIEEEVLDLTEPAIKDLAEPKPEERLEFDE